MIPAGHLPHKASATSTKNAFFAKLTRTYLPEAKADHPKTSKIKSFANIVNSFQLLTIIAKLTSFDDCGGKGGVLPTSLLTYLTQPWSKTKENTKIPTHNVSIGPLNC